MDLIISDYRCCFPQFCVSFLFWFKFIMLRIKRNLASVVTTGYIILLLFGILHSHHSFYTSFLYRSYFNLYLSNICSLDKNAIWRERPNVKKIVIPLVMSSVVIMSKLSIMLWWFRKGDLKNGVQMSSKRKGVRLLECSIDYISLKFIKYIEITSCCLQKRRRKSNKCM